MEVSIYLAKVFGVFFILGGIGLLLNAKAYQKADTWFLKHPGEIIAFGFALMLAGLFMVFKHNVWEWSYVGLITLIGWGIFLKGVLFSLFPQVLDMMKKKYSIKLYMVGGVVWLVAGLYLAYHGFGL